ncbi:hypothetical protein C6V83_02430 [Gordonia iterans]|uniref:Alkaline shock response membrane anchor protein AmaP n=1 Tax=Gordonia iterans TaxID=1004901 RepID=A0A2S0KCA8_9ACTN|nr:hypothetical protein [Gordonia iterans]AVL99322.1 hypothetical protein C6V83_02430 [Gordonia iterans]
MNRLPAAWNRISVGLVGIVLVVAGLALIFSQVNAGAPSRWVDRIDPEKVRHAADAGWWTWILIGVVVLAVLWGMKLLLTLVRPQAVDVLVLDGSGEGGRMTVAPGLIAGAVAAELAANPLFDDVSVKALDDRGAKILRITVTAPPTRSYDEITEALSGSVEQIREAVAGSGLHVQAMIDLVPPKAGK